MSDKNFRILMKLKLNLLFDSQMKMIFLFRKNISLQTRSDVWFMKKRM